MEIYQGIFKKDNISLEVPEPEIAGTWERTPEKVLITLLLQSSVFIFDHTR